MLFTLDIKLLGGFCLSCANKPVVGVTTQRPQALLAYLVLHRDIPQTLQQLAFQFWVDSTEAQARTNLRRELHHLRQGLPSEGKVYFAGEHTSTTRGWMQGALASGLRTAQEIHQART